MNKSCKKSSSNWHFNINLSSRTKNITNKKFLAFKCWTCYIPMITLYMITNGESSFDEQLVGRAQIALVIRLQWR